MEIDEQVRRIVDEIMLRIFSNREILPLCHGLSKYRYVATSQTETHYRGIIRNCAYDLLSNSQSANVIEKVKLALYINFANYPLVDDVANDLVNEMDKLYLSIAPPNCYPANSTGQNAPPNTMLCGEKTEKQAEAEGKP